jgi:ABC-type lipoprotein release transport system permease subunit
MTSLLLASRTVRRYRAQTILAIVGVAVIGALLFDMLLLSRGLLLSFTDLLGRAGFDIRIVGSGGMAMRLPIEGSWTLVDTIGSLPEVERVGAIRIQAATVTAPSRRPQGVTLIGAADAAEGAWTVVSGADLKATPSPPTSCPLLVGSQLAPRLGVTPGSTLQLAIQPAGMTSVLPSVRCRVVGVARFAFGAASDETVATTLDAFHLATGEAEVGDADLIVVASRPDAGPLGALEAIRRIRPELRAFSNEQVVDQFDRNGFAYFRQISVVLSSLTTVFAFMLVATLLTVSVNQRLGEIAALRAIGIRRGSIASMLLWESALLVGAGGLLALPLGEALAVVLDRILRQMPGLPDELHFFVFEPRALVIHVAVFIVTAIAAAAYPVWITTRLPIAATLRREVIG